MNTKPECPICLEVYTQPKMIYCGHSFCTSCLVFLTGTATQIKCPTCRTIYALPPGGVPDLPTNFALQEIVEQFKAANGQPLVRAPSSGRPPPTPENELRAVSPNPFTATTGAMPTATAVNLTLNPFTHLAVPNPLPIPVRVHPFLNYNDNDEFLFQAETIPMVLTTMGNYPNDVDVQLVGCQQLRRFATDRNIRTIMVQQYSAHVVILSCLRNHTDQTLLATALAALWNFAVDPNNQKILVQANALVHVAILSTMRNNLAHAGIQENGCGALWNLSVNVENKSILVQPPHLTHSAVVNAINQHIRHAGVLEQALKVIINLASISINQVLCVQSSVHVTVLTAMGINRANPVVQENACRTLWALSSAPENKRLLTAQPNQAHLAILEGMQAHPHVANVQENACGALWNLAVDPENRRLLVASCAVLIAIGEAMRNHPTNQKVLENGCGAIWNLASHKENQREMMEAPYSVQRVLMLAMRKFPSNQSIQQSCCSTIASLASVSDQNKRVLINECEAHSALLNAMNSNAASLDIQERAWNAFESLSGLPENAIILDRAGIAEIANASRQLYPPASPLQIVLDRLIANIKNARQELPQGMISPQHMLSSQPITNPQNEMQRKIELVQAMGFNDRQRIINLLEHYRGSVEHVIAELLNS